VCHTALMLIDTLELDAAAFTDATGWAIKPEGACKGDVCVPLPSGYSLEEAARRLGMALVHDDTLGKWSLGPAAVTGRALVSAELPSFSLPDLDGRPFDLSTLRGRKVVIVAWAPY